MNGAFIVQKPVDYTSSDCVNRIKRTLIQNSYSDKKIRIGHGGTLDPFATGVLVVLFGEATKLADTYLHSKKTYTGTITLGTKTATADHTGEVLETKPVPTHPEHVWNMLASEFTRDEYLQTPPMYSAKKKDGVALHTLARQGIEIDRIAILKKIYRFELKTTSVLEELSFEVECESGTYVRTLAEDLAHKARTVAHLKTLCRTKSSDCFFEDGLPLEDLLKEIETKTPLNEIKCYRELSKLGTHLSELPISESEAISVRHGNADFNQELCQRAFVHFGHGTYVLAKVNQKLVALLSRTPEEPYRLQRVFNEVPAHG